MFIVIYLTGIHEIAFCVFWFGLTFKLSNVLKVFSNRVFTHDDLKVLVTVLVNILKCWIYWSSVIMPFFFCWSSMLRLQKRLASSVLRCGKKKVWLDPNETNEIANANSREMFICSEGLFFCRFVIRTQEVFMDWRWILFVSQASRSENWWRMVWSSENLWPFIRVLAAARTRWHAARDVTWVMVGEWFKLMTLARHQINCFSILWLIVHSTCHYFLEYRKYLVVMEKV